MRLVESYGNSFGRDFTEDEIRLILGNDENVRFMYDKGVLGIQMVGGVHDPIIALGCKTRNPIQVYELVKYVVGFCRDYFSKVVKEGYFENISSVEIYSEESNILLRIYWNPKESYTLYFDNEGSLLPNDEATHLFEDKGIRDIERLLVDAILWANKVSPVPVHSIHYYFTDKKVSSDMVGTGSVYMGLSNARFETGVTNVSVLDEYALVFIEDVSDRIVRPVEEKVRRKKLRK